ncbi:Sec-independent protein translocase TatB [Cystobacter fuscus]|uniref:Sec-independent protein translocase subunit TatA/TatB n=1 Tax=Cystobacter fuscus TaxID=43 RepID=UPI002B28EA23|nr:Sec-independent protein translocase TatB [Cystobacter fuscus]
MFNVGAGELIFILVAALIVLGPKQLPEFARAIGKFVREFRRQTDDVRTVVEREFYKMDQEFNDEPRPPVPMGRPAVLPSPVPAVSPESLSSLPAPEASPDALVAPVPVPVALAASASADSPELPAPSPVPTAEPLPGTVAQDPSKSG